MQTSILFIHLSSKGFHSTSLTLLFSIFIIFFTLSLYIYIFISLYLYLFPLPFPSLAESHHLTIRELKPFSKFYDDILTGASYAALKDSALRTFARMRVLPNINDPTEEPWKPEDTELVGLLRWFCAYYIYIYIYLCYVVTFYVGLFCGFGFMDIVFFV